MAPESGTGRVVAVLCDARAMVEIDERGAVEEISVADVDDVVIGDVVLVRNGAAVAIVG